MPKLPTPGGDDDVWGDMLNEFIEVSLDNEAVDENDRGKIKPTAISDAGGQLTSEKGQADGYASLNGSGKVPASELDIDTDTSLTADSDTKIASQKATKAYVDDNVSTLTSSINGKVSKSGDTMSGNLDMDGSQVTNLGTTTNDADAATKAYVDTQNINLLSSTGHTGGVQYRAKNLDNWYAALKSINESPGVDVVMITDSLGRRGNHTDDRPWPHLVSDYFSRYTQTSPAPVGYLSARDPGDLLGPHMDSATGTPGSTGLGQASMLMANGDTAEHTGYMDAVTIVYTTRPISGSLEVRDGGSGGTLLGTINTVDPLATTNTVRTTYTLTPGEHTIHITAVSGGNNTILEGIYCHSGNVDKGVRIWPAAKGGATSVTMRTTTCALPAITNIQPDLIVVATGVNDTLDGDYDTDMRALLDAIRLVSSADIALWIPYILQPTRWTHEHVALARQIAEDYGLGIIDASIGIPDMDVSHAELLEDGTHPQLVTGRRLMAHHAMTVLSGDPIGTNLYFIQQEIRDRSNEFTALDASAVKLTGNQTVAGTKTFSSSIVGDLTGNVTATSVTASQSIMAQVGSNGSVGFGNLFGYPVFSAVNASDSQPQIMFTVSGLAAILGYSSAIIGIGPGGSSSVDTVLSRSAAGEFTISQSSSVLGNIVTSLIRKNAGSPEGSVAAPVGAVCQDTTNGRYYLKQSGTGNTGWQMLQPTAAITTESETSRVLALTDAWDCIRLTNDTSCDVTVPDNDDVAFPVGTQVYLRSAGGGTYTIVEDTSVTVNPPTGGTLVLNGDAALIKIDTDEWDLVGATVAA